MSPLHALVKTVAVSSTPDAQAIEAALYLLTDPCLSLPLQDTASEVSFDLTKDCVQVSVRLSYPAAGLRMSLVQQVQERLAELLDGRKLEVDLTWNVPAGAVQSNVQTLTGVKNLIAVASGKGGVGKSVTSVNLALALRAEGARVGLLDADIYGPSQGQMLGIAPGTKPKIKEERWFEPIEAHGIESMSMSYLVTEKTPLVWRGPMVSGALQQLIGQTIWQDLDYLIVDMPPGTGDIQLTLVQKTPVSGAVVVTTPQSIAVLDARRAIEMFAKVRVPVLGVIENMSTYTCPCCGTESSLFGAGGGEQIAREYDAMLLGKLPLASVIREETDSGSPPVATDPEGTIALAYREAARRLGAELARRSVQQAAAPMPAISVDDL